MTIRTHNIWQGASAVTVLATGLAAAPAVYAQEADTAEIDALVSASETPAGAIALARQQAQSGDLSEAAATLERALLADPNAHDARLFYAGLMCRLDDPQGARLEVAKLAGQRFSDTIWSETAAACGGLVRPEPARAGPSAGFSGEATLGIAYDSDALGPLISQIDTPLIPVKRDDGLSVIGSVRLNGKGKSYYSDGDFYGSASWRAKRSIDGPTQQYDMVDMRAGYGRQSDGGDYALGAVFRHARLFDQPYVTEFGGQAEVGVAHSETSRVVLRGEGVYQDYAKTGPARLGEGWRFDLGAAYEKRIGADGFVVIGAAVELKDGRQKDFGYVGGRLYAAYRAAVGDNGHYVSLSGTVRYIDFRNNVAIKAPDRKDNRLFARAAYGVPLIKDDLFVEAAASYTVRNPKDSATGTPPGFVVNNANYHSVGAEMRLVWKFGK